MIRLTITNTYTYLDTDNFQTRKLVWDALSYQVNNHHVIARRIGNPKWDGIKSYFEAKEGRFMTGLLPLVFKAMRDVGITPELIDARKRPPIELPPGRIQMHDVELRDYQDPAVRDFFKAGRGILGLATGAGKTECAAAITKLAGMQTLFLTHKVDLLHQTAARFRKRLGSRADIGIVGDSIFEPREITIATAQTVNALLKNNPGRIMPLLKATQVLIVDEAHRSTAGMFARPILECENAFYRCGLTATGFMSGDPAEDLALMGLFGGIVARVTSLELIERGILARPFFKFHTISHPVEVAKLKEWRAIYERGIVRNDYRNSFIAKQTGKLIEMGRKPLCIVQEKQHGLILQNFMHDLKIRSVFLQGENSYEERSNALDKLVNGKIQAIIATNIFDEGVDCDAISAVMLAAGNKSAPALLQRTGRAIRKKDEDNYAVVVDFLDRQHKKLLEHSMRRYTVVKNEPGFTVL